MSKKRKNFHYHYAEKFETQYSGRARGRKSRRMPVPPLAFFVSLVVLLLFGFVTTSFSVFVTTALNDPDMPSSGGLIVQVRNEMIRSADGGSSAQRKNNIELADTGAGVDLAETGTDAFISGGYVYCNPNGKWSADNAKLGAYFYNSDSDNAWSGDLRSCGDGPERFLIPGTNKTWAHVIFVRLNSDTTTSTIGWGKKWNQTANLDCDYSKNSYKITSFTNGNTSGSWEKNLADQKTVSLGANSNSLTLCSSSTSTTLTPSFTSSYYTNSSVSYDVYPNTGASVSNGVFTPTSAGTYTVTATFTFYGNGFASCTGTTEATTTITVTTCAITANPTTLTNMKIGETQDVTFTGNGNHTAAQTISVASADATKVSVTVKTAYNTNSKSITVTLKALKPVNSVNITATCAGSHVTKTLSVKVLDPTLTVNNLSLHEGESGTLTATPGNMASSGVSVSYEWAKGNNSAPITIGNGTGSDNKVITAGAYSMASTTVVVTATYTVDSQTCTKSATATITLSELDLSIDDLELFEGQSDTITPDNNTGYSISSYSWSEDSSGNLLDVTGLDTTASTFTAKAKAYNSSDHSIDVSLTANINIGQTTFAKTVTCTVTVKQITMTALEMTKVEGDSGTFTPQFVSGAPVPAAYTDGQNVEHPAYQWTHSANASKIELANATSETVTVKTLRLADNTATTSSTCPKVSLTVYYASGFSKTFTDIGTINITKSPYYLLGLGDWTQGNEARRMIYYPEDSNNGGKPARYAVSINLSVGTYTGESGFKIKKEPSSWYAESGNATATITRANQGTGVAFASNTVSGQNTGIEADKADLYTFYIYDINTTNNTFNLKVDFPMGDLRIYPNLNLTIGGITYSTTTSIATVEDVTHGTTLDPDDITALSDFKAAAAAFASAGFEFSGRWETSSSTDADDDTAALENITDTSVKIYAIFQPKTLDFNIALLPADRITAGTAGTEANPYRIPYGSAIKVQATMSPGVGVTPDADISYTWSRGSSYTALIAAGNYTNRATYTSAANGIVTTDTARTDSFMINLQATYVDALSKTRTGDYVSKTVYYMVKSALNDLEKTLGGVVVNQRIYSTAPDLKLKIYADLLNFEQQLDSTKENQLFAKTISLLRYSNGEYSEAVSEGGVISGDDAVPNYKSEVPAKVQDENNENVYNDTSYGASRGVNYFEFKMKSGNSYEAGSVYDFRTVVGTNSNYPTRPLYFSNESGTPLLNKRVMIFYYDDSTNALIYQTAQVVDGGSGGLYRFEIPTYKSGSENNTWDGNVWIAAFNTLESDKYDLPEYDGSKEGDAKLSFTNLSSSLFAKTSMTSVAGIKTLTADSISGTSITVS